MKRFFVWCFDVLICVFAFYCFLFVFCVLPFGVLLMFWFFVFFGGGVVLLLNTNTKKTKTKKNKKKKKQGSFTFSGGAEDSGLSRSVREVCRGSTLTNFHHRRRHEVEKPSAD